jgi:uncharacterized membrane protein (TIGR02234 family)
MRRAYATALLLDLVGAAVVLLVSTRAWQAVTIDRAGLVPIHFVMKGRTVDSAATALAVVALAAVVAVVATRGALRRVVGGVLALVGAATVWASLAALPAVSSGRARSVAADRHLPSTGGTVHVAVTSVWAWLSAAAGVLVLAAGLWIALRGHTWQAMSARYEAPAADDETARARRDLSMWNALDRGDDPTS